MKRICGVLMALTLCLTGCAAAPPAAEQTLVAATTRPVCEFTAAICDGTDLTVQAVISEPVSCLHDYSLSVEQARLLEDADLVVQSGAGLEEFMEDLLADAAAVIDASAGIGLRPGDEEWDAHIWMSPENAAAMVRNIAAGLTVQYPQYAETFQNNADALCGELEAVQAYGQAALAGVDTGLVTFHDGFGYFAESFGLTILCAMEEEAGSEVSARDLAAVTELVRAEQVPAVFVEASGSTAAASAVARETGCEIDTLDMAMGERAYFDAMYHNIDTIEEALT